MRLNNWNNKCNKNTKNKNYLEYSKLQKLEIRNKIVGPNTGKNCKSWHIFHYLPYSTVNICPVPSNPCNWNCKPQKCKNCQCFFIFFKIFDCEYNPKNYKS